MKHPSLKVAFTPRTCCVCPILSIFCDEPGPARCRPFRCQAEAQCSLQSWASISVIRLLKTSFGLGSVRAPDQIDALLRGSYPDFKLLVLQATESCGCASLCKGRLVQTLNISSPRTPCGEQLCLPRYPRARLIRLDDHILVPVMRSPRRHSWPGLLQTARGPWRDITILVSAFLATKDILFSPGSVAGPNKLLLVVQLPWSCLSLFRSCASSPSLGPARTHCTNVCISVAFFHLLSRCLFGLFIFFSASCSPPPVLLSHNSAAFQPCSSTAAVWFYTGPARSGSSFAARFGCS